MELYIDHAKRLWVVLLLISLCSKVSFSQESNAFNISVGQGLPSVESYGVYQDKKGFIWFATDNGVARFDGTEIETFNTKDGLIDPVVFGFHEDHRGRLWFRSFSGNLCYFENGKIIEYKYNNALAQIANSNFLNSIYFNNDTLWFSAGRYIGIVDKAGKTKVISQVDLTEFQLKEIGHEFLVGSHGVSFKLHTAKIDKKSYSIPLSDTSNHHGVLGAVHWHGNTYFSINNDIFKVGPTTLQKVHTGIGPISCLYVDKRNNLWIGYLKKGVTRITGTDFKNTFHPLDGISKNSVTGILEDNEGGIWFSTLENGVFHISNLASKFFPDNAAMKVTAVHQSTEGVITGSENGTVNIYRPGTHEISWTKSLSGGPVLSLFYDNKKRTWISTKELFIYDYLNQPIPKKYNLWVKAFAEDQTFTWSIGGLRLTKFSNEGELLNHNLTSSIHRAIFIEDSTIYIAERLGLERYDLNGDRINASSSLKKYKISQISGLNDSLLIVSTIGNGLVVWNKKNDNHVSYNTKNKFHADNMYSTVVSDSLVWLGTENGVICVSIKSLIERNILFSQRTQAVGLKSNKVNFLAIDKEMLWIFSDEGHTLIPVKEFLIPTTPPTFYLKKILVNDEVTLLPDRTKLPYYKNNVELFLGFIGFNNPTVTCRYKLFTDDTWKYTTSRTIQLPALTYGEYSIELEYSVDQSSWIDSNLNLNFIITPPFWRNWYIIIPLLLLIFGAGALLFIRAETRKRARLNELYIHQQNLLRVEIETLERERSRISKDLHDSVGNNLIVMKMKVYDLFLKNIPQYSKQVEEQFQEVIADIKRIIFELTPPGFERYGILTNLNSYIEKLKEGSQIEIDYFSSGPEYENTQKGILIFRIIQELITNSIKHSQASQITLHVTSFDKELNIIYQDNGIGLPAHRKSKGFGLLNIESRIESLNGTIQVDSGDFGTSFDIIIPK